MLKGLYDVAKKNIILCIWCNAMCLCGLKANSHRTDKRQQTSWLLDL